MQCDKCGKQAKVHLTQLVGGEVKKIALCNDCAQQQGVDDPTGFAIADMLFGGSGEEKSNLVPPKPSGGGRACPDCGFTLVDLGKIRRFGCATCYSTFRSEVDQMIQGFQRGARHLGKIPPGLEKKEQQRFRLEDLRGRLDNAVTGERYEEAASLRDEIQELEKEMSESPE